MNAEFEITTVVDANSYKVTHTGAASGSTSGGGGSGNAKYQISIGTDQSSYGYGWGTHTWNSPDYTGVSDPGWNEPRKTSSVTIDARNWSFDNFGEDLIATVSKGKTFLWNTSNGTGVRANAISNTPTKLKI
jgi:hypothetical protein